MLTIVLSHRREVHELEKRKRERAKKVEQRKQKQEEERQERMFQMMGQNPMMAYGMQNGGGGGGMMPYNMPMQMPMRQSHSPAADQSGNPYAPAGR